MTSRMDSFTMWIFPFVNKMIVSGLSEIVSIKLQFSAKTSPFKLFKMIIQNLFSLIIPARGMPESFWDFGIPLAATGIAASS